MNLLDTPGHRDFSEDTYRVLAAADAAVMVLDAAKGIEPQTLKLFEVCRARGLPLLTFINKWDRPGREPLELLDQIEDLIGVTPTPVTWPVGIAGDFRGVVDRRTGEFVRFTRVARGASRRPKRSSRPTWPKRTRARRGPQAVDELDLLDGVGADHDDEMFLGGESSPTFFGSAVTNFGVRLLLDAVIDLAPPPTPREDESGQAAAARRARSPASCSRSRPTWTRSHRDRIAFLRVCSGRFERGMVVTHGPTGQAVRHEVRPHGVRPGARDRRGGLARRRRRAGERHRRAGGRHALGRRAGRRSRRIPSFAPEHFSVARVRDTGRFKQFRRGIAQLDEEGVVQVLRDADLGDQAPGAGRRRADAVRGGGAPARERVRRARSS